MFAINKNGTKHKIGIIMPAFFPASRTTYDPTTSGLSATKVQGAIDAVEGQIANSSDAYSASKAYAVGDYCIYNDTLYRCVTACSAASWSVNSGCFVADTAVGALNKTVTSGTVTRNFVGAGYVTASGNYFNCMLPLKTSSGANVSIDSIGVNWLYMANSKIDYPFQLQNSSVLEVYPDYVVIELRFKSTQTPERMACARVALTLVVS